MAGRGGGGEAGKSEEIAELQKKAESADLQLREELKVIERMARENTAKVNQIRSIDFALSQERSENESEATAVEGLTNEHAAVAQKVIDGLQTGVDALEQRLESFDVIEHENTSLNERVSILREQVVRETAEHAEERGRLKHQMFNLRMQMENTFRVTLRELDVEYERKAFAAMREESRNAVKANAQLRRELAAQSETVSALMEGFKVHQVLLTQMQIEKDVLESSKVLQMEHMAKMQREHDSQALQVFAMQKDMQALNTLSLESDRDNHELDRALRAAETLKREHRNVEEETAWAKRRALLLTEAYILHSKDVAKRISNSRRNRLTKPAASVASFVVPDRPAATTINDDAMMTTGGASAVDWGMADDGFGFAGGDNAGRGEGVPASVGSVGSFGGGSAREGRSVSVSTDSMYEMWNATYQVEGGGFSLAGLPPVMTAPAAPAFEQYESGGGARVEEDRRPYSMTAAATTTAAAAGGSARRRRRPPHAAARPRGVPPEAELHAPRPGTAEAKELEARRSRTASRSKSVRAGQSRGSSRGASRQRPMTTEGRCEARYDGRMRTGALSRSLSALTTVSSAELLKTLEGGEDLKIRVAGGEAQFNGASSEKQRKEFASYNEAVRQRNNDLTQKNLARLGIRPTT